MGFLDWLSGKGSASLSPLALATPFADADSYSLTQVVVSDLFPDIADSQPLTREAALTIPAVAKARNLLCSTISKFPLVAFSGDAPLAEQPAFLYRSDLGLSPQLRTSHTIDDLIFEGRSLWAVKRGSVGQITEAAWLPLNLWSIEDGQILVDGKAVDESEVICFYPNFEGLLNIGSRTLRSARDVERTVSDRTRNPIPLTVISSIDNSEPLFQDEIDSLLKQWGAARRNPDGALGYLPPNLRMDVHGETDPALYFEQRNATRTDVGSFLNIRSAMLDGTASVDSLTYTTNEGEKNSFYELDLPMWLSMITDRLSLDDVVPRGQRVGFEIYQSIPLPNGIPAED